MHYKSLLSDLCTGILAGERRRCLLRPRRHHAVPSLFSRAYKGESMRYTKLGKTDIEISRICLGCMGFGDPTAGQHTWTLGYDDSEAIIKQALDAGINFFDTAMGYQGGSSERYVGRALAANARRDDVVVATKFVLGALHAPKDAVGEAEETTDQKVERLLDASLQRLGMDYVDLYIYHMWDWNTPVEELLPALDRQVKAGKIRALGISNCYAWQLAEANAIARANGWTEFVSFQGHMNAIAREDEREMVPLAATHGIALTPYSALAGGRLAKHPGETSKRLQEDAYAHGKYDATADVDAAVIEAVAAIADERGTSMTSVALAWLLGRVTAPVVGATKPHHIEGAVAACELELTPEEIARIEAPYVPHAVVGVVAENRPPVMR